MEGRDKPQHHGFRNEALAVFVGSQVINQNGQPTAIQDLPLQDLEDAGSKLRRVADYHEGRAIGFVCMTVGIVMLTWGGLCRLIVSHDALDAYMALSLLLVALVATAPFWIFIYDKRRRALNVVRAAELRWAEIIVEMATRHGRIVPPLAERAPLAAWVAKRLKR